MGLKHFAVRPAEVVDAAAISDVIIESTSDFKEVDFEDGGWEVFLEQVQPSKIAELIRDARYYVVVATVNESIAGMISVKNRTRIYQFFVHPTYAGQGLGRSLWNVAHDYCLETNRPRTIHVNSSSYAVPLYLRFGFVKTAEAQIQSGCISVPLEYRADAD